MTQSPLEHLVATIGMAQHLHGEDQLRLHLGDFHPGAHGGLELELSVQDGRVVTATPRIGLMHRSAEKLFEARDYRQIMMLANRHDWVSAVSSELGVALAVEQATGIVPPEKATWSRMLLAEAGRIGATALFLAALGAPQALDLRQHWSAWQESATGGRVHPMINRIGGLEHPLPEHSLDTVEDLARSAVARIDEWSDYISERLDLRTLGVLTTETAREFACSGPVGQASGVDWDLRRDDPYLNYNQVSVDWSAPVRTTGDAAARYQALVQGISVSATIIEYAVQELRGRGGEPVSVTLPKTLRAPESIVHVWTQNPLGIAGWLLVSDGDNMPLRLKARTPSFAHLQAMPLALPGTPTELLGTAVGSFFFVAGDADR